MGGRTDTQARPVKDLYLRRQTSPDAQQVTIPPLGNSDLRAQLGDMGERHPEDIPIPVPLDVPSGQKALLHLTSLEIPLHGHLFFIPLQFVFTPLLSVRPP